MNLQLESKTALVTGSSQGIGFAIAEALGREGATVVINSNKRVLGSTGQVGQLVVKELANSQDVKS
jgi:NAD(P)-dependent dehydrogenase (short-subunit alcohol dehydrogenase family)